MRSNNLQLRMQLRSTVQTTLNDIMYNNNISAVDMEEAVEHYLLSLKDAAQMEYATWAIQDKAELEDMLTAPDTQEEPVTVNNEEE